MDPAIVVGNAHPALGESVARALGVAPAVCTIERFPDGEQHVELTTSLAGREVYVVQPTCAPIGETLLTLLLIADAAWRAGAARIVAVVPYFGYARSDRRAHGGQPLAGRVVAGLFDNARFERVVTIDLHAPAIEGFFAVPMEHLDALGALGDALEPFLPANAIVVAPDVGAAKRADSIARRWKLPVAIVHKTRVSGTDVVAHRVTGDVRGMRPVIVDDMISTGGTLVAAFNAVLAHGAEQRPIIAATHAVLAGDAIARLASISPERLVVTDTLPIPTTAPFPITVGSVATVIADAVRRLHGGATS